MPSTATCWATDDTTLMLHMDGADTSTTFTDETGKTMTAVGDAQIDTAQSKFGGASGIFDGTGDEVTTPVAAAFDFGTGDYQIDCWLRQTAGTFAVLWGSDNDQLWTGLYVGEGVWSYREEASTYTFADTLSTDTWYHVAVSRNGTNLRLFRDGVQKGTTQTSSVDILTGTGTIHIGRVPQSALFHNGHIDEFRMIKGTAVWTADFTPPSAAYTQCAGAVVDRSFTFSMF